MNRSKIILAASTVVFFALVILAGVLAYGKFAAAEDAKKGRDREFKELEAVFKDDIFPSQENVAALKENVGDLEGMRDILADALCAKNVKVLTNVSASVFMRALQDRIEKNIREAPFIDGRKVVAPGFAFGFERYYGPDSRMPRESEVPRLVQQLLIVSAVVDAMYDSRVSEIKSLQRKGFEADAETEVRSAPMSRGGRSARRVDSRSSMLPDIQTELYSAQHFTVQLKARQEAVVDLLNRLARLDYFTIVTDIRLSKTDRDVRTPGSIGRNVRGQAASRGRQAEDPADESSDMESAVSDLPSSQRVMSGPDISPALDVTIDFDVYQFVKKEAK